MERGSERGSDRGIGTREGAEANERKEREQTTMQCNKGIENLINKDKGR